MKIRSGCLKLAIAAVAFWVLAAFNPNMASAGTISISISGVTQGTSITSKGFRFNDLDAPSTVSTFSGKDSIGPVSGQLIANYTTISGSSCTVPGVGQGTAFSVDRALGVLSYDKGQLFLLASEDAASATGCIKITGYSIPGTGGNTLYPAQVYLVIHYTIVGGTGLYEGATGTITSTTTGVLLWNDLTTNQFGSFKSTYQGSLTYQGSSQNNNSQ